MRAPASRLPPAAPARQALVACVAAAGLAVAVAVGLVAGNEPLLALGAVTAVLLLVALVSRPDLATFTVVAIIYSNAAAVAVLVHGAPLVIGILIPLLLALPFAYYLVVRRDRFVFTPALPVLLAFVVVATIAALAGQDTARSMDFITPLLLEGVVLYVLLTNVVRTSVTLVHVVWVVVGVGAVLGGLSLFQQLTGTYDNDYLGFAQVGRVPDEVIERAELGGPLGRTNRYAQILVVLLPLGVVLSRWARSGLAQMGALAATALIAAGVVLTFSRASAVTLGFLIVALAVSRLVTLRHIAALALGLALLFAFVPQYWERVSTLGALPAVTKPVGEGGEVPDTSVRSRTTENAAAILMFLDHPVLGVGPSLYGVNYGEYARNAGEYIDPRIKDTEREPHSLYLGLAAETGVVGLGFFLAILAIVLRDLVRARRRWLPRRPDLADLMTGFVLVLVGYLVNGAFLHLAYQRYFWLLLALAASAAWIGLRSEEARLSARSRAASGVSRGSGSSRGA